MEEPNVATDSRSSSDSTPWESITTMASEGDKESLEHEIELRGAKDTFRSLSRMTPEEQEQVITLMESDIASDLLEDMPDEQAVALVQQLSPADAALIVAAMHSDAAADLLGDIKPEMAEAIMAEMHPEMAEGISKLAEYDDDVAGGLMIREYLAYADTMTVAEVHADLRANAEKYRGYKVQYAYVTTPDGVLTGVLLLRDMMLAAGSANVEEVMIPSPLSVGDLDRLEEVDSYFTTHNYLAAPVVDEHGVLVGVITRDCLEKAVSSEIEDQYLKSQGIVGGEEFRSMPVLLRSRRRLSWLSTNIVLNVIAASIIAYFESTLQSVIALAVFLPIISDMSGCSGNQAVAVSMRELTVGLIRPTDFFYVWRQEIKTGFINGIVLGTLIGVLGWMWKGNPYLGLVAGAALALNTMVAVSIGGLVPMILKYFKVDPALASGPILTTVTDLCGFLLLLGLATMMLPYLV